MVINCLSLRCRFSIALVFLLSLAACQPSRPVAKSKPSEVERSPQPRDSVSETDSTEEILDGHQQMRLILAAVDQQSKELHPFLGLKPLQNAELAVQQYAERAPAWDRSVMYGMYGQELLRVGRTPEALVQMKRSLDIAENLEGGVRPEVLQQIYYQLGVASLREAENVNCVHCINGERCLFPIAGNGIHEDQAASKEAVTYLLKALELNPDDAKARWLLNIAYMTLGTYPHEVPSEYLIPEDRLVSAPSPVGAFRSVAKEVNLEAMGCAGGVIVDDFDGDLDLDVVMSSWDTSDSLKYFRNKGDGSFVDATSEANFEGINGGLNLVQADYDNDGDLDILVLRGAWLENFGRHPNSLLENDGKGHFRDVTLALGLTDVAYPTQTASWADFDLDGDLDLYIGNEGFPSQLFRNEGGKHFTDVAVAAGVANGKLTKAVAWGDFNGDLWPDIYASNMLGENCLYENLRDGTFRDVARTLGVEGPISSFPIWFWDANNDGNLDLFVASYQAGIEAVAHDYLGLPTNQEPDAFYFGNSSHGFDNRTTSLGYQRVTQPMGVNVGDIDNDGFLDFYLGTGYVDYEGLMPNLLFHNRAGEHFDDITFSANVGHLQKGHGIAFADFDFDGDLDIFAVMGGWFAGDAFARVVFQNDGNENHWLDVNLRGTRSNRFGIGCRVKLVTVNPDGSEQELWRWMDSGGSFGANPLRLHLGLGQAVRIDRMEVTWPVSQQTQVFQNVAPDQFVEVTEGEPELRQLSQGLRE